MFSHSMNKISATINDMIGQRSHTNVDDVLTLRKDILHESKFIIELADAICVVT